MSWIPENIVCIVYYIKGDLNLIITYLAHCCVQNIWCATRLVQSEEITRAVGTGGGGLGVEGGLSLADMVTLFQSGDILCSPNYYYLPPWIFRPSYGPDYNISHRAGHNYT